MKALLSLLTVALVAGLAAASHAGAASWSLQSAKNPTGNVYGYLRSVSCKTGTTCMAVGDYRNSVKKPLSEEYSSGEWAIRAMAEPANVSEIRVNSVSCIYTTECIAVGEWNEKSEPSQPLAEIWNGTTWSLQTPIIPAGSHGSTFYSVSCVNYMECYAVGYKYETASKKWVPLAERWHSLSWAQQTIPTPTGAETTLLKGVSCKISSGSECLAVGAETVSGSVKAIGEHWNGYTWSVWTPEEPESANLAELYGVSCASTTFCAAVGEQQIPAGIGTEWASLAYFWKSATNNYLSSTANDASGISYLRGSPAHPQNRAWRPAVRVDRSRFRIPGRERTRCNYPNGHR